MGRTQSGRSRLPCRPLRRLSTGEIPPRHHGSDSLCRRRHPVFETLDAAAKRWDVRSIIHMASSYRPISPGCLESNVLGSAHALEAARRNKVRRVSSPAPTPSMGMWRQRMANCR